MGGLAFGIPALFIGISSVLFGGPSLLASLLDVIRQGGGGIYRRIPKAFYTFAAAVILDMELLNWLWYSGPPRSLFVHSKFFFSLILVGSCAFLVITLFLLLGKSGPGVGPLRTGAYVLIVIAVLGIIGIIKSLPS
jgi:hypothetical protein